MSDVKRFKAPGPWITRELRDCVLASDYDALAAKLAAAERDAARYRHLREHCQEFSVRQRINPDATEWWDTLCGDGMDEAIDAAMAPRSGVEGEQP